MSNPYQPKGKNGKYKKMSKFEKYLIMGTLSAIVVSCIYAGVKNHQLSVVEAQVTDTPEIITSDHSVEKITKIQDKLLDELSLSCEVKGVKEPDATIILDTNNEMSLGRFQFQIKTVQHYIKTFEGRSIDKHEAITIALDPIKSRELARKIIFEAGAIEGNWTNCTNTHQLKKEVETIKAFMSI